MTSLEKHAVVLFAHGSRDPLWHKPMEAVAAQLLANQPGLTVRCAYLELSTPDLTSVCRVLMAADVACISVLPMFLGVGRHAREDLPVLLTQLQAQYPQVRFVLKPAVGEDQRLIQLLAQIAAE
jgi:sirohydrochlorin cobaltochelatase